MQSTATPPGAARGGPAISTGAAPAAHSPATPGKGERGHGAHACAAARAPRKPISGGAPAIPRPALPQRLPGRPPAAAPANRKRGSLNSSRCARGASSLQLLSQQHLPCSVRFTVLNGLPDFRLPQVPRPLSPQRLQIACRPAPPGPVMPGRFRPGAATRGHRCPARAPTGAGNPGMALRPGACRPRYPTARMCCRSECPADPSVLSAWMPDAPGTPPAWAPLAAPVPCHPGPRPAREPHDAGGSRPRAVLA